tara:strand:+ start:2346 stop:2450 length:105 start_codon:yes stop_codon:yes gene_type:complete
MIRLLEARDDLLAVLTTHTAHTEKQQKKVERLYY